MLLLLVISLYLCLLTALPSWNKIPSCTKIRLLPLFLSCVFPHSGRCNGTSLMLLNTIKIEVIFILFWTFFRLNREKCQLCNYTGWNIFYCVRYRVFFSTGQEEKLTDSGKSFWTADCVQKTSLFCQSHTWEYLSFFFLFYIPWTREGLHAPLVALWSEIIIIFHHYFHEINLWSWKHILP